MALPALDYTAPFAQPVDRGLYGAADLVDVAPRMSGGVRVWPVNCEPAAGAWPADPCADTGGLSKDGERGDPLPVFDPIVVWGYDACAPDEPEAAIVERAEHSLRFGERTIVEAAFAERGLSDAVAPDTVESLVGAVSAAEAALAPLRRNGVLHAAPALAAPLEAAGQIIRSGNTLRSPMGHRWSFGAGYVDADGFDRSTILATSPVTVWRDAVTTNAALDPHTRDRVAVAERMVVAFYECAPFAVNVSGDGMTAAMRPGDFPGANTFPGTE